MQSNQKKEDTKLQQTTTPTRNQAVTSPIQDKYSSGKASGILGSSSRPFSGRSQVSRTTIDSGKKIKLKQSEHNQRTPNEFNEFKVQPSPKRRGAIVQGANSNTQTNKPYASYTVKAVGTKKNSLPANSYGANSLMSKTFNQKKSSVPNVGNARQTASS